MGEDDFARSGNTASQTVELPEGPLEVNMFPHSMEPSLRKLGLPTAMKKGIINLTEAHTVCQEGDTLTPEQCNVLKLFGKKLVQFHIKLKCVWQSDGTFEQLEESDINSAEEDIVDDDDADDGDEA